MNNVIRAELYKLYKNPAFWVLAAGVGALSIFMHILILTGWWHMTGTPFDLAGLDGLNGLSPFIVPLFFNLFVSTLAAYTIAAEFSRNGVIKNQVMSGNKRMHIFLAKFIVLSLGAVIIVIVIPLVTGLISAGFSSGGNLFTESGLIYLSRAYGLYFLHFLCFTATVLLIAVITGEIGKTILFTLILSAVMFAFEKLVTVSRIRFLYEHTYFFQLDVAFNQFLSAGDLLKSIFIGILSLLLLLYCGITVFQRKEIQ